MREETKKFESEVKSKEGNGLKVLIEKNFEHEGQTYEPGETVDLPEDVAREAIENGAAKSVEELKKEVEIKPAGEVESGPRPEEVAEREAAGEGGAETEEPPSDEGFPEEVSIPAEGERPGKGEPDVWKELESEFEEPSRAPTWRPEEVGDQLLGEVTRTGRGPNGRLLEVRTPEGEKYVLWERIALKDLFDRAEAGDRIGVRFLGVEESSSGRSYHNFRTVLKRRKNHR
ncbi:hypothetical protein AKJ39_04320 [candidate division MSBL1 archaeon SCGC-AAA259J03]|uniref:DUF7210 domain-containing protein n=1 Tax=candidate division MSBL1 archaeon SCGC-AAA259J03 TaxID=1698269 RepID=A0A656YVH3_9EURY|nr:hypothetical protein AKJ39_04320 [candidate division MSBL1 archaeon SCGC-AAA259J03]